ncbi:histidine kinase dimerization/phosphoacceptor domain -containing protein [Bradyrhizobium sp. STM 3557]|uniref:histidine kinase dimerization/phosphoacceptor domain -containing protein n=1 Tax=Bradyrhizobium sp. STM 3557 TaxID=578920 RepID=UPI00388D7D85
MTVFTRDPPALQEGVLLRELHHRVSNSVAAVVGLVSAAAVRAEGEEAKRALGEVVELLQGCAEVHRTLEQPSSDTLIHAASYIHKLGHGMRRALLDPMNIQLTFATQSLALQPERCWRLGLLLHELVSIAARHACFEAKLGRIEVRLTRVGALVNCIVADNGWRSARNVSDREFRVTKDLVKALGGRLKHGFGDEFTSMIVSFPLTKRERAVNWTIATRQMKTRRPMRALASNDTPRPASAAARDRRRRATGTPHRKPSLPRRHDLAVPYQALSVPGELSSSFHPMDAQ